MENTIFKKYQKNGLIPSLGSSDDIYDKLILSAKQIAEDLEKNTKKILPYSLVAFDNQIEEDEPVLQEVENQIAKNWQMLRSHFQEMPKSLYRVVILQALENLVEKDKKKPFATLIYWSVVDSFPLLTIVQKEKQLLIDFLYALGEIAEDNAINEWSIEKSKIEFKNNPLKVTLDKSDFELDAETLKNNIYVAATPSSYSGINFAWVEPHYTKLSEGLSSTLNSSFELLQDTINENTETLQKELNNYFTNVYKNIQTSITTSIQSSIAVERRSQLLWWKETLYSRKLQKSYRKLTKFECTVALAMDLFFILPNIYPVSVDYILKETFIKIHGENSEEITIFEFLNQVNDKKNEIFLKQFFEDEKGEIGRTDLESFITKIIYTKMDLEESLISSIGIAPDKKVSYTDLSVWILHCLSVKHLSNP